MPSDRTEPNAPNYGQVSASQSTLEVIRLPAGKKAPDGEDRVQIAPRLDGGFEFGGTVGIHAADVVAGSATSISGAVDVDGPYSTADAATAAAIEWAAEQGAEMLYVVVADE